MKKTNIFLALAVTLVLTGCQKKQEVNEVENKLEQSIVPFKKQELGDGVIGYLVDGSIPLTKEDMLLFYQNEMTDNSRRYVVEYGNYIIDFKSMSYGVFNVFEKKDNQSLWILKGVVKESDILTAEVNKLWNPTIDEVKEITLNVSDVFLSQVNSVNGLVEVHFFAKDSLDPDKFADKAKEIFVTIAKSLKEHEFFYQLDGILLTLNNDESYTKTVTIQLTSNYLLSDGWETYLMTQSATSISTDNFTYIERG